MGKRKPLDPNCNGSVTCPVEGHTRATRKKSGWLFTHMKLTPGQSETLYERRRGITKGNKQ